MRPQGRQSLRRPRRGRHRHLSAPRLGVRSPLWRLHDHSRRIRAALRGHGRERRHLSRGARVKDSVPKEHKANAPASVGCFVLTISDSKTPETDTSGALIRELVTAAGHRVTGHAIVKDEPEQVAAVIRSGCAAPSVEAFILTGGTGITSRDSTYEAIEALLDKRLAIPVPPVRMKASTD